MYEDEDCRWKWRKEGKKDQLNERFNEKVFLGKAKRGNIMKRKWRRPFSPWIIQKSNTTPKVYDSVTQSQQQKKFYNTLAMISFYDPQRYC